ncbi:MAG: hypothetical protein WA432_02985 [Candidatus Babeliaceae bacterium]
MELIIRGPTECITKTIQWLEIRTTQGSLVIQNGHAPVIALLPAQDIIFQTTEDIIESIAISKSIMEVTRQTISLLLTT